MSARRLGAATVYRLREAYGDARGDPLATVRASEVVARCGVSPAVAERAMLALRAVDLRNERAALRRTRASVIVHGDSDYPPLLAAIPDPPPALWVRGDASVLSQVAVAIVGSRRCTMYGRTHAGRIGAVLASCGVVIVSGGARGIDRAAHESALRCDAPTIAVLGCGLGHCYPPEHDGLFERIAAHGCLLSEHPPGVPPRPALFPRRNRIISGLSVAVLLVEAANRSGALITARLAAEEHGREVMALPGPVDASTSAGCHQAIREGWAGLVTSAREVFQQIESAGTLVRGAIERSVRDAEVGSRAACAHGTVVDARDGRGLASDAPRSPLKHIPPTGTNIDAGADAGGPMGRDSVSGANAAPGRSSVPAQRDQTMSATDRALIAAARHGAPGLERLAEHSSVPIETLLQRLTLLTIAGRQMSASAHRGRSTRPTERLEEAEQ